MSDIFNRAISGDDNAFLELITPFHGQIYRKAYAYLKNEPDASDAVQEVVIKAYKHLRKIKQPEALSAWLTRTTINYCLTLIKREKRSTPVPEVYPTLESPHKNEVLQPLLMQETIQTLPRDLQVLIFLKYYDGFTLEEIAAQTHKPVGTVKTHLHKALKVLRKEVGQHD